MGLTRVLRVLAFVAAAALWLYAASRLWQTSVPDNLELPAVDVHEWFTPKQLSDATSFERFLTINALLAQVAVLVVFVLYVRRWERFTKESAAGRIGTGLLLGMLAFAFVWIVTLPFGIAAVWWEKRHGVSKVSVLDYAIESWFALGAQFLFVCMAIAIVMALARFFPRTWWIPGAVVFSGLALLFAFLSPYLMPDLDKVHRHDVRVAAKHLAKVERVDDVTFSVQQVHEFTTLPNAGATGFGSTKRVILWDTIVRKPFTIREIRPVLAHELAHLKQNHILKSVALFALFAFPLAFAIAVATRSRGGMAEPGAVPVAILVAAVFSLVTAPLQNAFVRRYETEADWVGLNATRNPAAQRTAMQLLATTSKSRPDPPAVEQLFQGNHPTILDRIALTQAWQQRRDGR